jgi:hypothetical protein
VVSSEKNNLSNHFYSTLEEEERGIWGGGRSPFAVLIALQYTREALAELIKARTAEACAHCSVLLFKVAGLH